MPPISAIRNALSAVGKSKAARAAVEGFDYGVAARSAGDSYGGRYGRSVVTNRTPQVLREGLSPLEQVARVGGRVAADSATFATQGLYYAINHPAAIATEAIQRGFSPIGATKQQAALTTLGVATALGVGSRAYGWNPTNIFRPAGYGASAPDPNDPRQTTNPLIEAFDRFRTRRGQILPYDKFLADTGQTREQFPEAQYKDLANFQKNRDAQGKTQGVMGGLLRYSGNPYYGPGGAANIFGVDVPVAAAAGAAAIGGTAYGLIRNANQKRFQELSAKVVPLPGGGVDDAALTATERADYDRLSRTIGQTPEAKLEAKASANLAASDQVLGKNRLPDYPVQQTRTAAGLSQLDPVQLRNEARSRGIKVETTTTPEQLIDRIMRSNVRSGFEVSGADMTAFTDAFGTTPAGTPKANTGPSLRPQAAAPRMAKMPGMAASPQAAPVTPPSAPRAANANTAYEQAYAVAKSRNLRTPSEIAQFIGQTPGLPDDALGTQAIAEQFINRMRQEAAPNLTTDPGFRSQVTGTFDAFGGRQSLRDRLSGGRGGAVSRASNIGAMGMAQPAGGLPDLNNPKFVAEQLQAARQQGDQAAIASWEKEAKRLRVGSLQGDLRGQGQQQTSLFGVTENASDMPLFQAPPTAPEPVISQRAGQIAPTPGSIAPAPVSGESGGKPKTRLEYAAAHYGLKPNDAIHASDLLGSISEWTHTGASIEEAIEKVKAGTPPPPVSYLTAGDMAELEPREKALYLKTAKEAGLTGSESEKIGKAMTFLNNAHSFYKDAAKANTVKVMERAPTTEVSLRDLLSAAEKAPQAQIAPASSRGTVDIGGGPRAQLPATTEPSPQVARLRPTNLEIPEPVISQRAGQITPTPGSIAQVSPESLTLDPQRFQYKIGYAKGGATGSLKGVEAWNPDLAGVVSVWRDPKDGKDYVVNGHNRIQKALDLNASQPGTVPQQAVRYLNAGTAAEARSTGALINIAEGQGTAYDAAKFFRDSGATPEKLQAYGIPAGRPVVQQGRALANLHEGLFQQAITGQLPTEQAIAIGESLPDHTDQRTLTDLLGRTKRKVSGDVIRELAGDIKASPKTVTEQATLFGTEELIQSNAIEKAETAAYVRKQLRDTASTFGTVSKEGKVAKLTQAGNVLDQAGNAQIATDAGRSLAEFDQLKGQTGAYNDILNEAARRRAAGESASSVNQWAYEQTRTTTAAPRRNAPEALSGGAEPRPERPAARIADPTANRPVSQTPAAPRVATVAAPVEQPSIATMQAAQKVATSNPLAGQLDEAMRGFMDSPAKKTWIKIPGAPDGGEMARIYVRKSDRMLDGKKTPAIDIANIDFDASVRGQGIGTQFFDAIQQNYPERALYVEAIGNDRLAKSLLTKQGFTQDMMDDGAPSVYRKPRQATLPTPTAAPVDPPPIAALPSSRQGAIDQTMRGVQEQLQKMEQRRQAAIARSQPAAISAPRGTIDIGGGQRVAATGNPFQGASTTAARLSIEAETGAPRRPATMTVGATVPVSRPMQLIPAPTQPNVYDPAGFQRLENRFQNNPPPGSTEYIQNADRIQLRDANLQGTRDLLQQVRDSKGQNRAIVRSPEALGIAPASGGRQQPFAMRSAPYTPTRLDPQASVLAEAYANNPNATYQVGQTTGQRGGVFAYEPAKVNPKAFLPSPAARSVSNIEAPPNFGAVNRLPNPGYTAIPQNQSLTPYNPNARAIAVGSPRSVQPFEAPRTAVTTAGRVPTIEPRIAAPQNTSTAIAPYTPPNRAVALGQDAGIESSTKVIGTRPRATTPAVEARAEGPLQRAISSITAKNPRLTRIGGAGLQGLGVVGAGADFTNRLQEGQKLPQAVIGTGAGVVGGTQGFALGAKLTPGGPIPKFVGGLVGGVLGAVGAGAVVDQVSKVEAPDRKQFDASVQKAKQAPGALGAVNRAIFAVGDFVNNPVEQIFGKSEGAKLGDRAEQQYQDALKRKQQGGGISPAQQQQLQAEAVQQQGIKKQRQQAANDEAARINANSNRLQQQQEERQRGIQEQIQRNTDSGKVISGDGALRGALSSFFGGGRSPSSGSQPGGGQPTTRSAGLSLGQTTNRTGGGDTQPMGQPNAPRVAQMRQPRTAPRSTVAPQLVPGTPEFEALDSKAKEKALIESSRRASANSRNDTTLQVSGDRSDDNTYRTNARSGDVRYTADSRSGDVRYTADSRSGDARYTADSRSGDVRYTADSRSGDVRYTADSRSGDVRDTNRTNLQRTNLQHGKGGSEDRVAASKLTGVRENIKGRHEDVVYRTDGTVKVANIKKDSDAYKAQVGYAGKVDSATITGGYKVQQEGVRQSGAANVANIKAGATMGAAVVGANAKVKVAEFGLEGTRYKADATVKVADVNRQSKAETENTKALSAINTGVIRSGAALMQREERDRVARLRALGVY